MTAFKHHVYRLERRSNGIMRHLAGLLLSLSLLAPFAAWSEGVLNVGLVPSEDPRLMIADNQALLDALHQSLGMEIKPFVATDYNGVVEALRAKKLDIALLGPFSYVLAASIAEVDPIAIPDTQKQGPSYYSLIIARKDRNIHSLGSERPHVCICRPQLHFRAPVPQDGDDAGRTQPRCGFARHLRG